MSSASEKPTARPLPSNYAAIFFEGPWFFRQDPKNPNRVLGACPYVNAPDHICEVGLWNSSAEAIQSPGSNGPGLLQEGDLYQVDIPAINPARSVDALFDDAHDHYHFPYFRSMDSDAPLGFAPTERMRQVSISMPTRLEVDGLSSATLGAPVVTYIPCSSTSEFHSYLAFLFIYEYAGETEISIGTNFIKQAVYSTDSENPHLHFRVYSPVAPPDSNGCGSDCSIENAHVVTSFESLRKMVFAPVAHTKGGASHVYPIFGISTPVAQDITYTTLNSALSGVEIGTEPPKTRQNEFNGMAACGQGGMAARNAIGSTIAGE